MRHKPIKVKIGIKKARLSLNLDSVASLLHRISLDEYETKAFRERGLFTPQTRHFTELAHNMWVKAEGDPLASNFQLHLNSDGFNCLTADTPIYEGVT